MKLGLSMTIIKTLFLSALFGSGFGYWYGIIFSKRMLLYRTPRNNSKTTYFSMVILGFLLNYILLFAGLVLLMRTITLNVPLFLCTLLASFGLSVYRFMRRPS